jgi:hypothetical protein
MDTTVEDLEYGRYRVLNYQYVNEAYFVVIMSDSTGIEYRLLINEGLIFDKVANMHELYKKSNYADARMLKQFVFSNRRWSSKMTAIHTLWSSQKTVSRF